MISGRATSPVSPRKALLLKIGILLSFMVFLVGCVTLHLLMDLEETSSISKSQFGQLLRILLNFNPMFAGVFVNGGLIGMLFCTAYLFERKDVQTQDAQETKKAK